MTQFTANEVRTESCKQGQLHRQPASDMLNAFADLLEAREKAVPVGMLRIGADASNQYGKTATFLYADACMDLSLGDHEVFPHPDPSDAERLAEALRGILEIGKRNMENQKYDGFFNAAREALAAHSAQAQPPAGEVHSCSFYCDRPECVKRQRDELVRRYVEGTGLAHPPAASATPNLASYWRIVAEAAEVLQMVLDSGVKLPPNWRWPLLDELSGLSAMMLAAQENPNGV